MIAVGLVGFSFVKILAPAYFSREDTRTPVRIGLVALAVNFGLSVTLAWYLTSIGFEGSHAGLALAISVAAVLNAWLLYRGLRKDRVVRHGAGWPALLLRVVAANAAMCLLLIQLHRPGEWWIAAATMERIYWLGVTVTAGAAAYFVALLVSGMRPSHFAMRPR